MSFINTISHVPMGTFLPGGVSPWYIQMLKKIDFTDDDKLYVLGDVITTGIKLTK